MVTLDWFLYLGLTGTVIHRVVRIFKKYHNAGNRDLQSSTHSRARGSSVWLSSPSRSAQKPKVVTVQLIQPPREGLKDRLFELHCLSSQFLSRPGVKAMQALVSQLNCRGLQWTNGASDVEVGDCANARKWFRGESCYVCRDDPYTQRA